jgi:hypothetical protein
MHTTTASSVSSCIKARNGSSLRCAGASVYRGSCKGITCTTHTYIHTHAHTHTHTHSHTCTHTHTRAHTNKHIHSHVRAPAHACTHTYTHAHLLARTGIHIHIYTQTHIHIHTHTHTHTQTHTEANKRDIIAQNTHHTVLTRIHVRVHSNPHIAGVQNYSTSFESAGLHVERCPSLGTNKPKRACSARHTAARVQDEFPQENCAIALILEALTTVPRYQAHTAGVLIQFVFLLRLT